VLDSIIKAAIIENQSVSIDFLSDPYDISGAETGFGIVATLANGIGVNIDFSLYISVDGQNYTQLGSSIQNFTDIEGSVTWDVINTNACFVKLSAVINTGSIDIPMAILSAKRRH